MSLIEPATHARVSIPTGSAIEGLEHAAGIVEPHWYAAYTCANHEKRVAEQLAERSVEHYLPLYESVRRWKDRRVRLQLPLFPGYVFVRLALRDRLRVLQLPSVARLVGFGGLPTPLPDEELQILRSGLNQRLHVEPHRYLTVGRRVQIINGPLAGLEGIFLRRQGHSRVVLSVDLIERSIVVQVDTTDMAGCDGAKPPAGFETTTAHS